MVAFDLDGTLVDSVPDLTWALNAMSRVLGRAAPDVAQVRDWVGDGVQRLVKRTLTGSRDGEPETVLFEKAYRLFRDAYRQHLAVATRFYPGVHETLEQLRERGLCLACITNKATEFTEPLLEALDLRAAFEIVICGDSLTERKPSPLPLLHAARHCRVAPEDACMVGDSGHDMQAAHAAGFHAIGVRYGYGNTQLVPAPAAILDSLAELPGLLDRWQGGVVQC
jgi:phosphoglycolate phosphatase